MKAIKTEEQDSQSVEFSVPFEQILELIDPSERGGPPEGWTESWWANVTFASPEEASEPIPRRLTITRHRSITRKLGD